MGIENPNDPEEIASKLIEIERDNPEYGQEIMDSLVQVLEEEEDESF